VELTVTQKRDNGLLQRTEVYFTITHAEAGTPGRAEIRKALAATLDAKDRIVVLDWARSEFGRPSTRGYAKVYESKERALALETAPILIRNGLRAAKKKEEAPKEAAPAAPAPRKEAPKAEVPKKEAPPKEEKKEAPKTPAKEEKKEPSKAEKAPAKKGAATAEVPKEKKPAAKKEGK